MSNLIFMTIQLKITWIAAGAIGFLVITALLLFKIKIESKTKIETNKLEKVLTYNSINKSKDNPKNNINKQNTKRTKLDKDVKYIGMLTFIVILIFVILPII